MVILNPVLTDFDQIKLLKKLFRSLNQMVEEHR